MERQFAQGAQQRLTSDIFLNLVIQGLLNSEWWNICHSNDGFCWHCFISLCKSIYDRFYFVLFYLVARGSISTGKNDSFHLLILEVKAWSPRGICLHVWNEYIKETIQLWPVGQVHNPFSGREENLNLCPYCYAAFFLKFSLGNLR